MEIDLELDPEHGVIQEVATLTLSGKGTRALRFTVDEGLSVERSRASSGVVDHRKAGKLLLVYVDPPLSGSRTLTFTLSGQLRGAGGSAVGPKWAVLNPSDSWYPSLPLTWATTTVRVRVPAAWVAIAPGRPVTRPDAVREWRSNQPLREVAVAAAPDLVIHTGKIVTTPLLTASSHDKHAAEALAPALSDPLAWFSGALATYPFDSFNLVFIDGLGTRARAGGMLVVPADTPIAGPSDAADLLAGQWFGEIVGGDGAWMRGFAAWQAATYCRDRARPLSTAIARLRERYLAGGFDDEPLSRADRDTPEAVVRGKGSAAPDMIRLAIGDRAFFEAVRDLFREIVPEPMSLARLRAVFEKRAGGTLERPFADWFDRTGVPDLTAELRTRPASRGGWRADLTLHQRGGVYALAVDVVFVGPGESHRETVEIDKETTSLFYILPFRPARVEIDPTNRIFRRTSQ